MRQELQLLQEHQQVQLQCLVLRELRFFLKLRRPRVLHHYPWDQVHHSVQGLRLYRVLQQDRRLQHVRERQGHRSNRLYRERLPTQERR